MKPLTILDSALFKLDATRSRCELWITAGNATEKIATVLFTPFLWHLRVAQQQIASGATDVRLCPSSFSHETVGNNFQWFSKATIERFVKFVSTPEVLERAFMVESKLKHVEEISTIIARVSLCHSGDSTINSSVLSTAGLSDSHSFYQFPLTASSKPVKEASFQSLGNYENIARLLLEILKSEWHMLRKTQDVIMHQAASAGFDIENIPNLLVFADCFEAPELKDSCLQFMPLLEKWQSNLSCFNEPDFETAICSAMSMIAADSPGYLENVKDNWFQSKFYKSILNSNNTQMHLSYRDHVAEFTENLVSSIPFFSQFFSAFAAYKSAGLFHETVTLDGLDSLMFGSIELESFWDCTTTRAQNLLVDPYEEGLLTVSRHDSHATLEQSVPLCGGDLNVSHLMEGASKHGIAESIEQMDRRASILNQILNQFDENFEALKSLGWSQEFLEKLDKLNSGPCEASEFGQAVELSTTMNLEHVAENRAESIHLQTDMQSVLSEGHHQSRQSSYEELYMLSPHNLYRMPKICTGGGSADIEMLYSLDLVTDASSFKEELLSISNCSYPADQKGRLYEQYREHRDAKLTKESAIRKAERRAKLEELQEALENRKAEMASRKMRLMENHLLTEQEIQGKNQAGKLDTSILDIEDMMGTLENSSTSDQQTSNLKSISSPLSPKSSITSTTQSSLQPLVSCSQKPVVTVSFSSKSVSKHHNPELTKTHKREQKNQRKPVPASLKGAKDDTTQTFSGGDDQLSQLEKGSFISARNSKDCINASHHKHAYKGFPSKSSNLASNPLGHGRKHRIFPTRKRMSAVSDSNAMQIPEHNSMPLKLKAMQSEIQPQSKVDKVSLTLTVSKNSKPFLRKGCGIGPGAGPGILKSKAPLASDSNRIHNEELLQTPTVVETFRIYKQTEQSDEELNQIESFKSSSEAVCNAFPAGEKESRPDDNQHSFLQCVNIFKDLQGDLSAITSSSGYLMHTADLQFKYSTSNAGSNAFFSPSSPNSTLQKYAIKDDYCATPDVLSNILQFKPGCFDETVLSDSGTSFTRTLRDITQLFNKMSAKSSTSNAAQLCKNAGIQNTAFGFKRTQQFKQLLKRLKSFLKFNRKNQVSSK